MDAFGPDSSGRYHLKRMRRASGRSLLDLQFYDGNSRRGLLGQVLSALGSRVIAAQMPVLLGQYREKRRFCKFFSLFWNEKTICFFGTMEYNHTLIISAQLFTMERAYTGHRKGMTYFGTKNLQAHLHDDSPTA